MMRFPKIFSGLSNSHFFCRAKAESIRVGDAGNNVGEILFQGHRKQGLVITHIFESVSYSYSVKRYSYSYSHSKHPGIIEYEYRPVD